MATKTTSKATAKPKTAKKAVSTSKKTTSKAASATDSTRTAATKVKASGTAKKPAKPASAKKPSNGNGTSQRDVLIQQMAYFIAEKRGFEGGDPVEDWLAAERQVDEMLNESRI